MVSKRNVKLCSMQFCVCPKQCVMKQLLELVFVIFGIIKVSVSVFSLGLIGSADVI